MEGVEFQIRSHGRLSDNLTQYPLSLSQRLEQGDAYHNANNTLKEAIAKIKAYYESSECEPHTASPDCHSCLMKKKAIRQAFAEHYLSPGPGRWDSENHQYREEMARMIDNENQYNLHDLYKFHESALREHFKADFCKPSSNDDVGTKELKQRISKLFDDGVPLSEILALCSTDQVESAGSPEAAAFITNIQDSRTPDQRAEAYIKYYCSPKPTDSSSLKNLKAKYARQFSDLVSHDVVISAWNEEAKRSQAQTLDKLKRELNDFQMAKSANTKRSKRRAEQADQRSQSRGSEEPALVECGLAVCPLELDLSEENILCVLCDWLNSKGVSKERVYYCCDEHSEEDFAQHDRTHHKCSMGTRCYYHPASGPKSTTSGGVCVDCLHNGVGSYFCSSECFEHNINLHRDDIHYPQHITSEHNRLEAFVPAEDIKMIT